jgi:hypothetical protein
MGGTARFENAETGAELPGGEAEIAPYDVKLVFISGK